MDIVLGVSVAPSTVRMVLVEGENADGVTVDEDSFAVSTAGDLADQVVAAILGTRESAAEGDYRLASTGVTYPESADAAALRDALAAHKVENVMLVSAFLAAAALAQAAGSAVGFARTGLLFVEPDTATVAVVDSADGSIADVRRQPLHGADAPSKLAGLLTGLAAMGSRPDGLFVVGNGVDVEALKPHLETATALPVSVAEEPEIALARGAALASASAPLFASSTEALAYSQVPDWTTAELVDPDAADSAGIADLDDEPYTRKPFLVALGAMTVFFAEVLALVISLATAVRPAASERPQAVGNLVVPASQLPAPAPKAQVPAPPTQVPAPPAAAPNPVEQPAPAAQPAPVPEAPAPAPEAVAPAPAAPAPVPAADVVPEAPPPAPQAPPAPAPIPAAPAPAPAAPVPVPVPIPAPRAPVTPLLPWIFDPPAQSPSWQPGSGGRDRGVWLPNGGHGSGGHGGSGAGGFGSGHGWGH